MPHLVVLYTPNLESRTDLTALSRALADTMVAQRDEGGAPLFPVAGTRVLAYPAAHFAVADGSGDFGFIYLQLRRARGRTDAAKKRLGDALAATVRGALAPMLETHAVGVTLQIDEGAEVFDAKLGNLHALFQSKA